ncbi:MAG: SH3 domain-containing protein [Acidobacteriaceae bacterium]
MNSNPLLPIVLLAAALALSAGCKRTHTDSTEFAYISAPQAFLRDHVSAVYNKVGTLNNGERVRVLQHDRRFVKVRNDAGIEGWMEQRNLADAATYERLAELAGKYATVPAQAHGVVRNEVNMHVTPARDSDKLFQLKENDKVDLIQRAVTAKNAVTRAAPAPKPKLVIAVAQTKLETKPQAKKPAQAPAPMAHPPAPPDAVATSPAPDLGPPEDWWLVRDANHRVGWVLGRMLDVDVPLEVAQYAEGKRVVAAFVLATVEDPESNKPNHQVPYYLMLTNEPHDGQVQDFNAIRVFTWNTRKHRYETAYRERDLNGYLPVSVAKEDFGKDGVLPTFTIRSKDDAGAMRQHKYRMEGVLVKRIYAPGEQPEVKPRRQKARAKHSPGRNRRSRKRA